MTGPRLPWLPRRSVAIILIVTAIVGVHLLVPPAVDRSQTRVLAPGSPSVSERARALHSRLTIADMHADSLIWGRSLLRRNDRRGQIDLPRLADANVAVQAFAAATKVPSDTSPGNRGDGLNLITLSAIAQWWPPRTWWSLTARAEYVGVILGNAADRSEGRLLRIGNGSDLEAALMRHAESPQHVGALLTIEGLHALEGNPQNVRRLWDHGFRIMGLVHHFDNDLGGSATGFGRGGLTAFGAVVLSEMERIGAIPDLAHASPALIHDVTSRATRPVVVSHTGIQGMCNRPRNLSDADLRAVARTGGLIGIGFWAGAVCGSDAAAIVRAIKYTAGVVGLEHVAIGSDFDGDRMPFDVRGLVTITEQLMIQGFSEDEIRLVMGGNLIRFLRDHLPRL